jgi:hypothetical protein
MTDDLEDIRRRLVVGTREMDAACTTRRRSHNW